MAQHTYTLYTVLEHCILLSISIFTKSFKPPLELKCTYNMPIWLMTTLHISLPLSPLSIMESEPLTHILEHQQLSFLHALAHPPSCPWSQISKHLHSIFTQFNNMCHSLQVILQVLITMHNVLAPAAMHLGALHISLASGSWEANSKLYHESDHGNATDAFRPMHCKDLPKKQHCLTSP